MNNNLLLVFFEQAGATVSARQLLLETVPYKLRPIDDQEQCPENIDRVIGVVPAAMVTCLLREVPPKQIKYLSKTLPFLVEDDLIAPIDTQHIVSQIADDNKLRVLAVDDDLMQSFISWAADHDLKIDTLYVDADLMAVDTDTSQGRAVDCDGRYLIKTADGLVASIDSLEQLASFTAVESGDSPEPIDSPEPVESPKHFFAELICSGAQPTHAPINLLQGDYAPKASLAQRSALVHRVLLSASVLMMAQIMYWVIVGADYKADAEHLREQSTATYQQYFPTEKTIIDIRSQVEGHLTQVEMPQTATSFLGVLESVGIAVDGVLEKHSAGGELLVKSIQYKQQAGDLELEISAPSVALVEQLRTALIDESSLNVQTEQINQSRESGSVGQGISARLRISNLVNAGVK